MNRKKRTGWKSFSINQKAWMGAGICLATFLVILILPILPVQAAPGMLPDMQEEQPEGYWQLTGSDTSDTWQGDKFHGMESEYSPNYGENSLGANYTQYNIRFNNTAPQTVASSLNGTCRWDWDGGFIPDKIVPGTNYPFSMTASANYDGSLLLGSTVNAYTQTGGSNIAFAQAYLNIDGSNTSASNTTNSSLNLPAGQSDGEGRAVTQLCQIDIVSVQRIFTYAWKETSCTATLTLPPEMGVNKEFTPQVSVVDKDNKSVKPDKETWYYNDAASELPMKWDGKQATILYEYICPGGTQTHTANATIPKAPSCTASLTLPDKMVPDKEFAPQVSVVDSESHSVTPDKETWYYNDAESSQTMKWDGKQAVVKYDYICPNETETKTVSITIPPAKTCDATIVLPDKMEADKEFTPRAEVVNKAEGTPVVPQQEKWFYNDELSALPIKWDGKEAALKYEYLCPLDTQTLQVEKTIPPVEGGNFILVVGGLAAVAAAGLAAAGAGAMVIKGGPKSGKSPGYVLQVDKTYLEVKLKDSVPLHIQVWKINADGSTVPASDASIRVELPADRWGLMAAPVSGTGSMTCSFTVPYPKTCTDVPVSISASAGLLKKSAQVTVRIVPLYELELSYLDPANTHLEPGGGEVYATATLAATPMPDASTSPDELAERITLSVDGPNSQYVRLSTAVGQHPYVNGGKLWIPISVPALPAGTNLEAGNPSLKASFTDGNQQLEAMLPLEIKGECKLGAWVLGKQQADVLFFKDSDPPGWVVPEIVAYFHDPLDDSTPVHPSFDYTFDNDSVKFEPDVLTVSEIYAHDKDQYTIKCTINPAVFLEDHFGENLEQHDGIIKVTITPQTGVEKKDPATVSYQLRPQFELFATQGEEKEREYKGIILKPLEVVVDGDDQLPLYIGVYRTDKGVEKIAELENELDPALWICKHSLEGGQPGEFMAEAPEDAGPDEAPQLLIKSVAPKLFSPEAGTEGLTLHLEGSLLGTAPAHYQQTLGDFDLEIKPLFPNLKLWVVPGRQRGESEAWMVVYLENDPQRRLPDTILKVKVESIAEGQLLTPGGDQESSLVTGSDGTEQVNLWYKGIDWSNYQQALFTVSASITNRDGDRVSEPVEEAVNVGNNVRSLLADLSDRAEMLKLNNPYYEDESLGLSDLISLTTYRPLVRGPVWNASLSISEFISSQPGKKQPFKFARDYVCSELRDRIAEWLITRRHYRPGSLHSMETMQKMNGIEFDHFTIGGVHNYEALFLSGMQPEVDPRGLDPWWKQHWHDPAYLDPDGLITNNWQRIYSTETAAWLQISLTPLAVLAIWSGGVTVAFLLQFLGPAITAYAAATAGELGSRWEMGTVYAGGSYHFERKDNSYTPRSTFINEWAAEQGR